MRRDGDEIAVQLQLAVPRFLRDALRSRAEAEGRSMRSVVRQALEAYLYGRELSDDERLAALRAQALAEAEVDKRDEIDRIRREFLLSLSHELRTPLTSVIGYAELLKALPEFPDDLRSLVDPVIAGGLRLEKLITDLLELQRLNVSGDPPQRQRVSARTIVLGALRDLDTEGRSLSVNVADVVLNVDPAQIERMLVRMVENAVKHTWKTSQVFLRVRPVSGATILLVEDDGPGVPSDMRHEVFEPFRRGADPETPGAGVGLALVKHYAERHGGEVWVEESPSGGARFVVRLPS